MASTAVRIPRRNSVVWRAILTLAIVVFSFLLTLAVGIGCAVLPFIAIGNGFSGIGGILLIIMGLVLSGTILWSLIPRREPLNIIGIEIDLSQHHRLKALVEEIAAALEERLPSAVFLVPDANAFVTERGGKRIMGLGLPLLALTPVSEFRAVLAHEFAHYYCGDTRLGPMIHKAQSTMIRTIKNLASENDVIRFLARFAAAALLYHIVVHGLVAYWKIFLRITQKASRQQEFRSDELACYVAGPKAVVRGLERIVALGPVWQTFCKTAISPTVSAGFRPPLADGLCRFYATPNAQKMTANAREAVLGNTKVHVYDTHPPMKLRIDRVSGLQIQGTECNASDEDAPAISLLDNVDLLEQQLMKVLVPDLKTELRPMNWATAASEVWIPTWRKVVAEHAAALNGHDINSLPELVKDLQKIAGQMRDPPGVLLTREQRTERAANLLSTALALQLIDQGWTLRIDPGQMSLDSGDSRVIPAECIAEIRSGKMTRDAWREWCQAIGAGASS
jgi:Zn-dependent protease with chaperone function